MCSAVADPVFPLGGGVDLLGAWTSDDEHFLVKMYVKMKESGPAEGKMRALDTLLGLPVLLIVGSFLPNEMCQMTSDQ